MKKLFLTFLLLVSSHAYAEFQAIGQDNESTVYYNPADVVLNQGLIYTSFITDYNGPQSAKIWGGMKIFNSSSTLVAIDCPKKLYRVNSIRVYEGNFTKGQMLGGVTSDDDPSMNEWKSFPRQKEALMYRVLSKIRGVCKW